MSEPAETERPDPLERLAPLARPRSIERFEDALRHRRRVQHLRIVLPILAAVCLLAIFFSIVLSGRQDNHVAGSQVPGIEMHAPILHGISANGKPFEIIADQAVQTHDGLINLTNVRARMELEDGLMIITSDSGIVEQATNQATIFGNVHVKLGDTYHLVTERAKIDFKAARITGTDPVKVDGPMGTTDADGFTVEKSIRQIHFMGNAHSVINPDVVQKPAAPATPGKPPK